MFRLITMTVWL